MVSLSQAHIFIFNFQVDEYLIHVQIYCVYTSLMYHISLNENKKKTPHLLKNKIIHRLVRYLLPRKILAFVFYDTSILLIFLLGHLGYWIKDYGTLLLSIKGMRCNVMAEYQYKQPEKLESLFQGHQYRFSLFL